MPELSSAELFPSTGTAGIEDFTTVFGRHTRAEAVTVLANAVAGLKRAFQGAAPIIIGGLATSQNY